LAIDRDVAADALDERPLDFAGHEHGGVAQEVNAGFGREGGQDGERIQPVEMVGDQHVGATSRNPFAALDPDSKQRMEQGHSPKSYRSICEGGLPLDRKEIGWRLRLTLSLEDAANHAFAEVTRLLHG